MHGRMIHILKKKAKSLNLANKRGLLYRSYCKSYTTYDGIYNQLCDNERDVVIWWSTTTHRSDTKRVTTEKIQTLQTNNKCMNNHSRRCFVIDIAHH